MDSLTSTTFVALNNINYSIWVRQAEWILEKDQLWKYYKMDTVTVADADKARQALNKLFMMIDPEQAAFIREAKTPKEAWDTLASMHAPNAQSTLVPRLDLLQALAPVDSTSQGFNKFAAELKKIFADLAECECALPEVFKVHLFINKLGAPYTAEAPRLLNEKLGAVNFEVALLSLRAVAARQDIESRKLALLAEEEKKKDDKPPKKGKKFSKYKKTKDQEHANLANQLPDGDDPILFLAM
jgi:hypothetical protein